MSFLLARALLVLGPWAVQGESPREGAAGAPQEPPAQESLEAPQAIQIPSAEERRVESLYGGALVGVQDAQDFAETPGYRQLLDQLSRYGAEELRLKATRELDVADALAHPDAWRGQIVRLRGLVAKRNAVRLARPLNEHVDVWRAIVTEADGTEGVVVDFLEEPPQLEVQQDVIDVEAVFFRTLRYENKKGGFVEAPYLIGRSIRLLDQEALPKSTAFDGTIKIVILVAVGYLVIRILNTMRKDPAAKKRSEMAEARAARKLRERASTPLHPGPPAPEP